MGTEYQAEAAHGSQQKIGYAVDMAAKDRFSVQFFCRQSVEKISQQGDNYQPEAYYPGIL